MLLFILTRACRQAARLADHPCLSSGGGRSAGQSCSGFSTGAPPRSGSSAPPPCWSCPRSSPAATSRWTAASQSGTWRPPALAGRPGARLLFQADSSLTPSPPAEIQSSEKIVSPRCHLLVCQSKLLTKIFHFTATHLDHQLETVHLKWNVSDKMDWNAFGQ